MGRQHGGDEKRDYMFGRGKLEGIFAKSTARHFFRTEGVQHMSARKADAWRPRQRDPQPGLQASKWCIQLAVGCHLVLLDILAQEPNKMVSSTGTGSNHTGKQVCVLKTKMHSELMGF
jgi:hypothetical protein